MVTQIETAVYCNKCFIVINAVNFCRHWQTDKGRCLSVSISTAWSKLFVFYIRLLPFKICRFGVMVNTLCLINAVNQLVASTKLINARPG